MPPVVLVDRDGDLHTVSNLTTLQHALFRNGMRPDTMSVAEAVTTVADGQPLPASLQRLLEEFPESGTDGGGAGETPLSPADIGAVSLSNAAVLVRVDRSLRSKVPPNRGIALERAGISYHLWQRLSQGQWMRTTLGTRTNTNGGVCHLITEYVLTTPVVAVDDDDAAITYAGTWTTGTNASAHGGDYRHASVAGATATYTTPAATTRVGVKVPSLSNGGLFRVTVNGDPTRARMLPTAQDLVEQGLYPATILTTGGGTLLPTDRVLETFTAGSGRWDATYLFADDLPPAAHTVVLSVTGYQRTASTGARGYLGAFIHGQAQRIGDAGTINATLYALDGGAGLSATEYAFSGKPPSGSNVFFGSVHDNEAEDSLVVALDGVTTTPADNTALFPTGSASITRVSRLLHPGVTGTVATVTTVYVLDRDGVHIDVTVDWNTAMTINAAYAMLPLSGVVGPAGQTPRALFDRGDLLDSAEGPMRFTGAADVYRGISKSAAAWLWQSTGRLVGGVYIEDIADFTNNWAASGQYFASIEDRNGQLSKVYISRVGSGTVNEDVTADSVWRWRAHYLFGSLLPSTETFFG